MPVQRLSLHYERIHASAVDGAYGLCLLGYTVGPTSSGGFFTSGFQTPLNMDRSRPTRLFLPIYNPGAVGPAAGDVLLTYQTTTLAPGSTAADIGVTHTQAIPAAWPAGKALIVELLNAGVPAYAGGFFQPANVYGIRFVRPGNLPLDTWAATLGMVSAPWLEYSENCRNGMCF